MGGCVCRHCVNSVGAFTLVKKSVTEVVSPSLKNCEDIQAGLEQMLLPEDVRLLNKCVFNPRREGGEA